MSLGTKSGPDRTWLIVALVLVTVLVGGGMSLAGHRTGADATGSGSPTADVREAVGVPTFSRTDLVEVSAAAAQDPAAAAVVQLLDRHFNAINQGDYATWTTTVVARRAADQSQESWQEAFRSTNDGSVVVTGITAGLSELTVELSFVSMQDLSDAPPELRVGRICWDSRWPVEDIAAGGRIGTPMKGVTTMRAC